MFKLRLGFFTHRAADDRENWHRRRGWPDARRIQTCADDPGADRYHAVDPGARLLLRRHGLRPMHALIPQSSGMRVRDGLQLRQGRLQLRCRRGRVSLQHDRRGQRAAAAEPVTRWSGIVGQGLDRWVRAERRSGDESGSFPVSDVPEVTQVMSLKYKDEFLMHGVVLQNRVFRTPARAMFHVKPFSPAPLTHPSAPRCFT